MVIDNNKKQYSKGELISRGYTYVFFSLEKLDWWASGSVEAIREKADELGLSGGIYRVMIDGHELIGEVK